MRYAEVAVDAPIGQDKTLSYGIPPTLVLEPGQMVWVPLGARPVQGIVFQIVDQPQVEVTRDVLAPVEPSPLITAPGLDLARWISLYYMSSMFQSVAPMLPPGFGSRVRSYLRVAPEAGPAAAGLTGKKHEIVEYVAGKGETRERDLPEVLGKDVERETRLLIGRGLLRRRWEFNTPKMSHRYESYIRSAGPLGPAGEAASWPGEGARKQRALCEALSLAPQPLPLSLVNKEYGASAAEGLLSKGLAAQEWIRVEREPALQRQTGESGRAALVLTAEQSHAVAEITAALDVGPGEAKPFLLHGVTGSGKTEVYLRALECCVSLGRKGIYLVPEISLTPQTVHRLSTRFPGKVAVLHSGLSLGEQFDQWWRIRAGDYQVVVGPRSALFAPVPDLGLIVIDEEHEWTYKQESGAPYYHARCTALRLAELVGAVVVMGSATPAVETYHRAKTGGYTLLEMPHRISSEGPTESEGSKLARVEVCDMRRELKEGNRSIFSRTLATALRGCVGRGEQAVLFLNRRGAATVVQCRDCGFQLRCRRCSVALTYHAADVRLLCHQCNQRIAVPRGCPHCRSPRIRYLGLGTQRVMEELGRLVPGVKMVRWDRDTARGPLAHERIMAEFLGGAAQVLIGTQMVAKGLHVPNVSLVGVILADIGLNLPDFRAGERGFQLLCQVAGRAGRGGFPGKVVIQTYDPTNYAIEAAARQDYGLLYSREIGFRRQQRNPPFTQLVHMTYLHTNVVACQQGAERMGHLLRTRAYSQGLTDIEVVGPAPAFQSGSAGGTGGIWSSGVGSSNLF